MKKITKALVLSLTLAATIVTPYSDAFARGGYHRHYDDYGWRSSRHDRYERYERHERRDRRSGRDALAIGIVGLAAGALIGKALSEPSQPRVIYQQPASTYYPPAPQPARPQYRSLEPWTAGWDQYCANTYRSFNPQTGTYRGYDGRSHFCNAS